MIAYLLVVKIEMIVHVVGPAGETEMIF